MTAKGKEAHAAHEEVHLQFYSELRTQLSDQEVEVFETCVEKLIAFLKTR